MRRPELLYRYRSFAPSPLDVKPDDRFEREVAAIAKGYVFCSNYTSMNDPMEGYYRAEFSEDVRAQTVELLLNGKLRRGLACFSETNENDLLWTHYAGNWSGICIEYEYSALSESVAQVESASLFPIVYSSELISIGDESLHNKTDAIERILRRKKDCWSYEQEWRLISNIGRHKIIPETVTKIFMGSEISGTDKLKMKQQIREAGLSPDFFQMEVSGYDRNWVLEE